MSHYQDRLAAECSKTAANYDFYFNSIEGIKSKIKLIRYEDLALDFASHAREIYNFADMNYNDLDIEKLEKKLFKASPDNDSRYKTQRKLGRERILRPWIQDKILLTDELDFIQEVCKDSMSKWNYQHVINLEHAQHTETVLNIPAGK